MAQKVAYVEDIRNTIVKAKKKRWDELGLC